MRLFPDRKYSSGMRWCFWRWTDVVPENDGIVYLVRLHFFQTPFCSCMLHWLLRPDPQPDLHDHPVTFLSVVLSGGYEEEIPDPHSDGARIRRRVSRWNFVRALDTHRIVAVSPGTKTLVIAGRVVREWGFHSPSGWKPWRQYVVDRKAAQGLPHTHESGSERNPTPS
jgi:hypothetical protein